MAEKENKTASRKDLARYISKSTGIYVEDAEYVLQHLEDAISKAVEDGYNKINIGTSVGIRINHREEREIWDGIRKQYTITPPKHLIKLTPLYKLKKAVEKLDYIDK